MIRGILIILSLTSLYSCLGTKPIVNGQGLVELSSNGDYIRPIKTPVGYYYNSPKTGKVVRIPIMR